MKSYTLSQILTADQFNELKEIVRTESVPHKAITNYIKSHPEILKKLKDVGLLTEFFAYQLEYILTKK